MKIDIEKMIAISKVNQNFSEAARLTDEHGLLTIMKNSKPKFVLMTFEKFEEYEADRDKHNCSGK
ncbi:type II toxin-antitoxin system Phd/YefM family antitoxin [Paenibacillus sp. S150]|uniref:type II toxin-antitoxin system Phd/YefM family antitoxin n=1 Tax=Paenibacillus sp. S150 TaxID=2749826 RepID=UPI001C584955|nr:type II toxin-antitoxin system Phd/YefM family antitoxin [Paenibacillus sp. S150]MBW4080270.1 type II toxin-antitoxin system Phd/YefM family antitoxin [Paenibacillus sp. S150]